MPAPAPSGNQACSHWRASGVCHAMRPSRPATSTAWPKASSALRAWVTRLAVRMWAPMRASTSLWRTGLVT